MPHTQHVRVRVGGLEVDLSAGELRGIDRKRSAERIILPQQPLRLLSMLLERPGQVVSREAIQKQLWPNDTVVEFEHSINAAIAKLRKAFGDSANEPSYIETIAKRGYRLIAPTEWLTDRGESSVSAVVSDGNGTAARMRTEPAGLTGRVVSHYRVLDIVGGGGMGVVYRAEDLKLGRQVALKFLPEDVGGDARALARFEGEARAASALDHPNICSIYEFGEHDGQPFIVMQLLDGETLRERLASAASQKPGPEGGGASALPLDQLLDIASQIADGLQAAHERGIIHRDIKPANIFITKRGLVKVLDFGVAKLTELEPVEEPVDSCEESSFHEARLSERAFTRTGLAMGTVGYMSPEQVRGEKVDARTDIFSFGVVLYEMATGQRAFSGQTAELVQGAIVKETPAAAHRFNAAIPPQLEQIINRAMEKDRELRYQTVGEMAADLQSLLAQPIQNIGAQEHSPWKWLAAVAMIVVAAIAGGLYWRSHRVPKLTEQDTVVIADFDNKTGDPVFDDTLRQGLVIQLTQSPYFGIVSDSKVRDTLKLMNRTASEPLNETLGREVCVRSNSRATIAGSIAKLDQKYSLTLRALDCITAGVLAEVQENAINKEWVIKALDRAALALRAKLGESLLSVERYATPLPQATTASLEALKAYSLADKIEQSQGPNAGVPLFKRALELDPNFAIAHYSIGIDYQNLGEGETARPYLQKAFELRDRVSERERLIIESTYYLLVIGDLDKAADVYESWHKQYPRDRTPLANVGLIYAILGEHDKCLEKSRAAKQLDPTSFSDFANLGFAYMNVNRLDSADKVFEEAERRGLTSYSLVQFRYIVAFLKADKAAMAQMVAASKGKPGTEDLLLATEADTAAWYGKLEGSRKLTKQAVGSAERNDARETAGDYMAAAALREAATGNSAQAMNDAKLALSLSQHRDVKATAALASAQAGDITLAKKLAAGLKQDSPQDTIVQRYWLPTIDAAIASEQNRPQSAIRGLADMGKLDYGAISNAINVVLCPVYVRGNAYLQQGDGKSAAAEFQKFVDHYGLVENFFWGALARLGLARAYALEAQTDPSAREKARTAYLNLLTLWKDADPDIPIYKQAKAEYAKLQ